MASAAGTPASPDANVYGNTRRHPITTFTENNTNHDMQLVYTVRSTGPDYASKNETRGSGFNPSADDTFHKSACFSSQFHYSFNGSSFRPDIVGSFQCGTFEGVFDNSFNAWRCENPYSPFKQEPSQGRNPNQNRNEATGNGSHNSTSSGTPGSEFVQVNSDQPQT